MKNFLYILLVLPILALAQSTEQNYVKGVAYKQPVTTAIATPTPLQASVSVTYFDGLGRPMQQVAHKQSATGMDIVTPITYDAFGRQTREYLPRPVSTSNMLFTENTTVIADPTSYYTSSYGTTDGAYHYSEKRLEASPLNRVLEQGAPGADWAVNPTSDADHTIKFDYQTNAANEVKLFKATATWSTTYLLYATALVNNTGTTYYDANQLYKTITKDENWTSGQLNTTEEFKNKQGQVVLKRTFNLIGTAVTPHDTYYVYDQFGNLAYVIPPLATGTISTTVLGELCYQYKYDSRNRLVEKKFPGKQWEFILYDKLDRVLATGPANSPLSNVSGQGWLFTKYDALSRPVLTGWLASGTINATGRNTLQATINGQTTLNESKSASNTTINSIPFRYTTVAWPTSGYHVLTVNYYDDYNYTGAPAAFSLVLDTVEQVYYNNSTQKPKGLATGSWVRVLTTSTSTAGETSHTLYDKKSRPVRSHTSNHLGGYTYVDTKLDFAGKALYTTTYHRRRSGDAETITREDFAYSDQDRLLTHTHKINGAATGELIAKNEYYELGQLKVKRVGDPVVPNPTGMQKVDYTYNIRGWLKGINDVDNLAQAGYPTDLFGFKLNYNAIEISNGITGTPLYNGNISETHWKTGSDNFLRKYSYGYDNLNRLTNAVYMRPATSSAKNSYNESIQYDKNGNIIGLQRNGYLDATDGQTYAIDGLTYTYASGTNRLVTVTDATNSLDGFTDGVNPQGGTDYSYDSNGNMTQDWNKKIVDIAYNHLNLPVKVTFSLTGENRIDYIYNALGTKVQKTVVSTNVQTGTTAVVTDYLGGFQYKDERMEFFPTAEGYVSVTDGVSFNYVYNYTDHLGNIRLSYTRDSGVVKVLEENHYYPFGMRHSNYGEDKLDYVRNPDGSGYAVVESVVRNKYQYKYNGKEYQDELSLNWYDYQARNYDPAIGRWMNIDPLAEESTRWSPYNYAMNNPVYFIDPDGMEVKEHEFGTTYTGDDARDAFASLQKQLPNGDDSDSGNDMDGNGGADNQDDQEDPKKKQVDPQSPEEQRKYQQDIKNMSDMFGIEELETALNLILLKSGGTRSRTTKTTKVTYKKPKVTNKNTADPYDLEMTHGLTNSKATMAKLKSDIQANGMKDPIKYVEFKGKKYVVDGHHRLRIAKELGIKNVPIQKVNLPFGNYRTPQDLFN